jgi:hypothetical protein
MDREDNGDWLFLTDPTEQISTFLPEGGNISNSERPRFIRIKENGKIQKYSTLRGSTQPFNLTTTFKRILKIF